MSIISVSELRLYPEYIETVSNWLYSEWGNNNKNFWCSWIKSSMQKNNIPKTYIITVDKKVAGTYSLWRCDLQSRQDLYPWFGGLYVSNGFRGKKFNNHKLGEIMQKHAFSELKKMGYDCAYLFTEKEGKYYERNGWEYQCDIPDENDNMVKLYKIELKNMENKNEL